MFASDKSSEPGIALLEDASTFIGGENTVDELLSSKRERFFNSVTDFRLDDIPSLDANDIDSGDA